MCANKQARALPKTFRLPGSVHIQLVRCGHPRCRCARGEKHGAFYRFWREKGKLRKTYVRQDDLEAVKAACEANRKERAEQRWLLMTAKSLLSRNRVLVRQVMSRLLGGQQGGYPTCKKPK